MGRLTRRTRERGDRVICAEYVAAQVYDMDDIVGAGRKKLGSHERRLDWRRMDGNPRSPHDQSVRAPSGALAEPPRSELGVRFSWTFCWTVRTLGGVDLLGSKTRGTE